MNVHALNVGERQASEQAAEQLEKLAAEARNGEITGFYGIVFKTGRQYQTRGTGSVDRLVAAGALFDSAIAELGYAVRQDYDD